MKNKFFQPIRVVFSLFFFFLLTTAFAATEPVKIKTDPGKSANAVSIASAEELGNFVRQKTTSVSLSTETGTIRYESPTYFLNSNDLSTNVTATYNLSTGNVQSLFIVTKYRTGQQTFTIFPYDQGKTEVTTGPATAEWILMELNRINSLSQPNQYIQQSSNQTSSGSSTPTQPEENARSGSQPAQPKKLQK